MLLAVLLLEAIFAVPVAHAINPAIRVNGAQLTSLVTNPCANGSGCLWWDGNTTGPVWHKADNTNVTLGGGGGSGTVTSITMGTGLSSTQSPLTTAGTMSVDQTFAPTWTGVHTWSFPAVGTAQTTAVSLKNTTAATSTVQQYSPMLELTGQAWNTTTPGSEAATWALQTRPVQGTSSSVDSDIVAWQTVSGTRSEFLRIGRFGGTRGMYFGGVNTGVQSPAGELDLTVGGTAVFLATASTNYSHAQLVPHGDNTYATGSTSLRWSGAYSYWYDTKGGAALVSGATITPTAGIHHVTGTAAIATIATTNVPASGNVTLTLIPDAAFTTTTTGNIALASSAIVNRALTLTFISADAKWYPSY